MVAVINETNARKYFGADDPIGKTIVIDMTSYSPRMTVVGVVADSRLNALDKDVIPEVFWPMAQLPASGGWAVIRTSGNPSELANAVRGVIRELDPSLAITEVIAMDNVLSESVWRQRLTAVLLGFFARRARDTRRSGDHIAGTVTLLFKFATNITLQRSKQMAACRFSQVYDRIE